MDNKQSITQNKRLIGIITAVIVLLLIPFIAMQFSTDVKWSRFDFLVAGGLLLGTGLVCELVMRKVKNTGRRFMVVGLILIGLFLVWAELAVGIFGTPLAGS